MEERRKFPRLNWSVEVRWKKSTGSLDPNLKNTGSTKDISAGGIRLILKEGVQTGDVLELDILLGGGKTVQAKGRVVWVDKFQITGGTDEVGYEGGIEFIDMDDQTGIQINNFIFESHKPRK